MSYREAIEFLYSLRVFGTKFGLENTLRLAELAGNPQQNLRFIHVAGTNGKGSTCAMLESIYRAAGLKTGLFTSPHLISFCERIQVNRQLISPEGVISLLEQIRPLLSQFPVDAHPTFFEVITVMALKYFAEQQCQIVIWETGLGGRLDATNIVTPLATIITNVQYDHQQWLGNSLREIAAEKAGIIKPGVPIITATEKKEALEVIQQTARSLGAPITTIAKANVYPTLDRIELPLVGEHQRVNAALAAETARMLQQKIPVSDAAIRSGLESVIWPGRLQLLTIGPGRQVLLDGAHNSAGAQAVAQTIQQLFPARLDAVILGILHDKDCEEICRIIAPIAKTIYACPVRSERAEDPLELARFCSRANQDARVVSCVSLEEALKRSEAHRFILITGSLYLIGQALELLQGVRSPAVGEQQLNEWTAMPAKQ